MSGPYSPQHFYDAMTETYRQLTGFPAASASDVGIRMRALAEELSLLAGEIEAVRRDAFPQTGEGAALDLHGETVGLTRRPPVPATGTLRFYRSTPAAADIPIPLGLACADGTGEIRFATTCGGEIPAGKTWAELPAAALLPGEEGNLPPGEISAIIGGAPGLLGVTNPGPFGGGLGPEGDESFRARLLRRLADPPNPVNGAFYREEALAFPGVRSVRVLPGSRGAGTVDVAVAVSGGYDPGERAAALQARLRELREIGTDVAVFPAARREEDVVALITAGPGEDRHRVAERCRAALAAYLKALDVGQPLYLARLAACLTAAPGVENLRILSPAGDCVPQPGELICGGEIAVEGVEGL